METERRQEEESDNPYFDFDEKDNISALIKYLDPNTQKQKLLIRLFNLEYSRKQKRWIQKDKDHALIKTKAGMQWVQNITEPFFGVSAVTNRFKRNDIILLTHNLINEIGDTMKVRSKRDKYGIGIDNIKEVGNLIVRSCAINLFRSNERGIDVNLLNQNTKFLEHRMVSTKDKKSLMDKFNPGNALK